MRTIDQITKENFDTSFNLLDILNESVFYPASGSDAKDMEFLSLYSNSFVHVDYSISKEEIENGMKNDFNQIYELIGIKSISKDELTPNGNNTKMPSLKNSHELKRLNQSFIKDKFKGKDFTPFALWAVYELKPEISVQTIPKATRFSFLHIGGEACATFDALYLTNKINPLAVSIIAPGQGFGDNWTLFTNKDFRFYQSMSQNSIENNVAMPTYVLTDRISADSNPCFWDEYQFHKRIIDNDLRSYKRNL